VATAVTGRTAFLTPQAFERFGWTSTPEDAVGVGVDLGEQRFERSVHVRDAAS
jgi:hypothetical protein